MFSGGASSTTSGGDASAPSPPDARGFAHLRLDGSTSLARRRYETALFNKPDGRHFVYLCSTRAGGLGINLQSADTVILADPDWNPTYDQQAQDRAHRLGQKRPVTVIRMCHASSVEEGILAVAARKASLAAAVLAGLEAGADVAALDAAALAAGGFVPRRAVGGLEARGFARGVVGREMRSRRL